MELTSSKVLFSEALPKKKKNVKFERLKIVKKTILKCSIKLHYKMS